MEIVFLHGLESGPHGSKYQALRQAFGEVAAPDCTGVYDEAQRLEIIRAALADRSAPLLVVGSSMGGLMALLLQQAEPDRVAGLVLCAPAIHRPAAQGLDYDRLPPTIVIHGRQDDVVPFAASRVFGERLRAVDDDHRLSRSMAAILKAVGELRDQLDPQKNR